MNAKLLTLNLRNRRMFHRWFRFEATRFDAENGWAAVRDSRALYPYRFMALSPE